MYSAIISAWYMYGSTNEVQVIKPSTSSLVIPASSSANLAPLTYSCVALRCGTTPTSVSAAPTIATFPRSESTGCPSLSRNPPSNFPTAALSYICSSLDLQRVGESAKGLFTQNDSSARPCYWDRRRGGRTRDNNHRTVRLERSE